MKNTIYIIDDDDALRDSLAEVMLSVSLPVATFASPHEFLDAVPVLEGGCVITDIEMPGMSGLELLHYLRDRAVKMPIFLMTGRPSANNRERAERAGATGFFPKPVAAVAMLEAVRLALETADKNLP